MKLKTFATASCLAIAMATSAFAAPIDFEFSFTDGLNTAYGLISGLDSNGLGQQASEIYLIMEDTAGQNHVVFRDSNINFSSFDVVDSVINVNTVALTAYKNRGVEPWQTPCPITALICYSYLLNFDGRTSSFNAGFDDHSFGVLPTFDVSNVIESSSVSFTPVAPVPLPASGILLLTTGLGCAAALKRRKKRTA